MLRGESRRRSGGGGGGSPGSTAASVATPQRGQVERHGADRAERHNRDGHRELRKQPLTGEQNSKRRQPQRKRQPVDLPAGGDEMPASAPGSSPVPAVPPRSFGVCMRMMVQQMPLMNPPMTGVEMKLSTFPARSAANSSSQSEV